MIKAARAHEATVQMQSSMPLLLLLPQQQSIGQQLDRPATHLRMQCLPASSPSALPHHLQQQQQPAAARAVTHSTHTDCTHITARTSYASSNMLRSWSKPASAPCSTARFAAVASPHTSTSNPMYSQEHKAGHLSDCPDVKVLYLLP
jgi:hypothetical protein